MSSNSAPRPALLYKPRYRTEIWSYNRLWDEANRVASRLQEQGIEKGDRIVLWAPNSPRWVACFFANARLGSVLVPLDVRSGPDFVHRVVTQSEPKLALLSSMMMGDWNYPIPALAIDEIDLLANRGVDLHVPHVTPDDMVEVMFTSGTTGDPKGVVLSHGNITSNAEAVGHVIPDLPYLRLLSILPLSHMFEQTVGLVLALSRGASIFYPASRQSTALFRAFTEHGITTMLAVPQALQLFMDGIEREGRKQGKGESWERLGYLAEHLPVAGRRLLFRSLHKRLGGKVQFFVSGGAPLDPALISKWELLGIPVLQGYGATETGPVITATSPDDLKPGSVGKAVRGVEFKLVAELKALPGRIRGRVAVAAAADYFFTRTMLGAAVALVLNAFPFSRSTAVRPTLEHCASLLDRGWSILLYPEGTRSTTGQIGSFKAGVGLLAVELDVPVVPVRIEGLERILPKGRTLPRRGRATITFGRPLRFEAGTSYNAATTEIEEAVRSGTEPRAAATVEGR